MSAMNIYLSGWNPRGIRKSWDRSSISTSSAGQALGQWISSKVTDACAWFDENDALRVLVADTDDKRRVTYRRSRSGFTVDFTATPTLLEGCAK